MGFKPDGRKLVSAAESKERGRDGICHVVSTKKGKGPRTFQAIMPGTPSRKVSALKRKDEYLEARIGWIAALVIDLP
jgi:hypothetical protein